MPALYFDLIDVIVYLGHSTSVTGIQRVQLELVRVLLDHPPEATRFVVGSTGRTVLVADRARLIELQDALDRGPSDASSIREILHRLEASADECRIDPGDVLFVGGLYWSSPASLGLMARTKAAGGRVGILCHDIIPITHSEYCPEELTVAFARSFELAVQLCDFIVANSQHVKGELSRFLDGKGLDVEILAVPLAHDFPLQKASARPASRIGALANRPFVLFLSTIEPRKNHLYTLAVWQRLLDQLPDEAVPDLVWGGKAGWQSDGIIEKARSLGMLAGKLHILGDLSDSDVAHLYRDCWLTIFPSHVEGWGLPLAESLMWGKPCIAAKASSLPEVAGDLAWYVDPNEPDSAATLLKELIAHPEQVTRAADRIRRELKPRTWATVAAEVLSAIDRSKSRDMQAHVRSRLQLEHGRIYRAGAIPSGCSSSFNALAVAQTMWNEGWYAAEPWGRWLKSTGGRLLVDIGECEAGPQGTILLGLTTTPHWKGRTIKISNPANDHEATIRLAPGASYHVILSMPLQPGLLELELAADRHDPVPGQDPRLLSVGLTCFGVLPPGSPSRFDTQNSRPRTTRRMRVLARPRGTRPTFASRVLEHLGFCLTGPRR